MNVPKTALVIGLGKSGRSIARLLLALGSRVRLYDRAPDLPDLPRGAEAFLGSPLPPPEAFEDLDALVLSPGVPPGPFRDRSRALAPRAAIVGELGLAWSLIPDPAPRVVLVTGTNGKSTVTALVGELLRAGGRTPFVGGNLGEPLADCVHASLIEGAPWPTDLVLECSSYQLETTPGLPTAAAMILNVTPDHLDRYPDMRSYAETKGRIFEGLTPGGLALLDHGDAWTDRLAPTRGDVRVVRVGHPPAWLEGDALRVDDDPPLPRAVLRIAGRHNAQNALFALACARHLGVAREACVAGLSRFEGLPHRMHRVRELDGVTYYNDSKATNVVSAIAGLSGLDPRFVLIAGGRGKGDDLTPLRDLLHARGRGLVCLGEAAAAFEALAEGKLEARRASDMGEAVAIARSFAQPGDAVVLSPACASFDQFRSYAHRGEVFEQAVLALTPRGAEA